ncbi:MAG: S8 family serine peptidase [Candidatus Doudnabacteria bacterium]
MTQRNYTIFAKILIGILVPVFLFILLPKFSQASSPSTIQITFQVKTGANANSIFTRHKLKPTLLFANIFRAQIPADQLIAMQHDPDVNYAQIDHRLQVFAVTTSDPFFTADASDIDKQWYLPKIKVPDAWGYTKGLNSVIVAVIDTGIHASHVELNDGRVIGGFNVLTNQPILANTNSDDNGHGTSVAGVIGAIPNNVIGIAGIDWNIKLMPVKAIGADGSGDTSAVAGGIVWATDHGANIINLSLGGSGFNADLTLSNAITYAYNHGVLIVSAAGNDQADHGLNLDTSVVYPVCADNGSNMVLGVAATDSNDLKADFSNFGHNCVDISAPGERIITTAYLPNNPSDNVLIYGSGTSLAAPIVSGVAALLKSTNVNLSNVDLQNILMKTSDPIDALNQTSCLGGSCNGFLGKGRINALSSVMPQPFLDGSLFREAATGNIYFIENKTKRLVSAFVMTQRGFDTTSIMNEFNNQLASLPTGSPLPPVDGTLIMSSGDPQVYVLYQGLKRPVTYLVFVSRGYRFSDIQMLSPAEVANYASGDWYWPPDGTMVLVQGNPRVFVMDQQVARPVTFFVFTQRHLSFAKVVKVTADEFSHIPPAPDQYWLSPVEGTLVKSDIFPGIYVIENGVRRLLSFQAFTARGYQFASVKTLPELEVEVITPGLPIE